MFVDDRNNFVSICIFNLLCDYFANFVITISKAYSNAALAGCRLQHHKSNQQLFFI